MRPVGGWTDSCKFIASLRIQRVETVENALGQCCKLVASWLQVDETVDELTNRVDESEEKAQMDDLISRQAVIDSLHRKFVDGFDSDRWWNSISVLHVINSAPSVTPKQRTGRWIMISPTDMCCSECNEIEHLDISRKFCAYCGTKMQEVEQNDRH